MGRVETRKNDPLQIEADRLLCYLCICSWSNYFGIVFCHAPNLSGSRAPQDRVGVDAQKRQGYQCEVCQKWVSYPGPVAGLGE